MKDIIKIEKVKKILLIINIVVIIGIIWFYICRFIHFYRLENPKISSEITLGEYLTLDKNITVSGSGLYKIDNQYVFMGVDVNNYLYYSGILWRIVSINEDSIKLITNDLQTSIFWGNDLNYDASYIRKWLNKFDNVDYSGIFYDALNTPEFYLKKDEFCIDMIDNASYSCSKIQNDYVGLLTVNEYEQAKGRDSYLNIDSYFWTSNVSNDGIWYVMDTGEINDQAFTEQNYYSYGVRPVINLKSDIKLLGGIGSKDNPYYIENEYDNVLGSKNIGQYVNFSDYMFRIINKDIDKVVLALDGFIKLDGKDLDGAFSSENPNFNLSEGIGYYLNNDFYNSLKSNDLIVPNKWYSGIYINDYTSVYDNFVEANIGLMKVGDFYINDYDNYYLLNRNNDYDQTVYKVLDNKLYADLVYNKAFVRPAFAIRGDVLLSGGIGTKELPYIIQGEVK